MRAASTRTYGSPAVLEVTEVPRPRVGPSEILVEVRAASVTAGDMRLRSADFPSISALPGRLMVGLFRPKHPVQGTIFAGRVVEVGSAVTRHRIGDDVFGYTDHGAYAEYLAISENGAIARMPEGLSYEEAAAIPYGAGTALHFLRELGSVRPGDRVLVLGAAGGVGRFAVPIAKHLGAHVTAVCSSRSSDLVRSLGADEVIDYATDEVAGHRDRYDVIFDIADASSFERSRPALTANGRYLTLTLSIGLLFDLIRSALIGDRRAKFGIAMPNAETMDDVRKLAESGVLRPVIGKRFPLDRIADAHSHAEEERSAGATIVYAG